MLLFTLMCLPVAAGTTDDRHPDRVYLDYAEGFAPYTLNLKATSPAGKTYSATAVAIAEHYALTAAHVAHDLASGSVGGKEIGRVTVHPEWKSENMGEADLAMLEVPAGLGLSFYPPLCDGEESCGAVVSIAGYGITGRLSTGYATSDGKLRAGTNTIHRVEEGVLVCLAMPGSSPMEYCIAPGCSGGPLFLNGRLAGINSYTSRDKGGASLRSRTGEESGHCRVSTYLEWIREVAGVELATRSSVAE